MGRRRREGPAHHVQFAEPVLTYLRGVEGLSPEGRRRLCRRVAAELGRNADHYLQMYPRTHESYDFHYGHAIWDGDSFFNFH